jgi:tRNA(Ile)-lysidine synthase
MNQRFFASEIAYFIEKQQLISPKDKILVAVSGGADSLFLAFALKHLGYEIAIAHVNFQLRGEESNEDEKCVQEYAHRWEIPFFVKRFETQAIVAASNASLQVIARELRYAFFEEVMEKEGYSLCATAHHADDNAENLLMHLFSGNNSKVFSAIPIKRGKFIRPLLCLSKKEILEASEKLEINFRADSSNQKNIYKRNGLRNRIFPILQEMYPSLNLQLQNRNVWYELQYSFIEKAMNVFAEKSENTLDWTDFEQIYGKKFLPLLIVHFLEKRNFHGYDIWNICKLIDAETGKFIEAKNRKVYKTRTGIEILDIVTEDKELIISKEEILTSTKEYNFGGRAIFLSFVEKSVVVFGKKNEFYLDAQKIDFPLVIRFGKNAEKMKPFGMKNFKKISDIFIDEKFSATQKKNAIFIADATEIICLSDFRMAEKGRITEETSEIFRICIF